MVEKNASNAANPLVDAPIQTIGKLRFGKDFKISIVTIIFLLYITGKEK